MREIRLYGSMRGGEGDGHWPLGLSIHPPPAYSTIETAHYGDGARASARFTVQMQAARKISRPLDPCLLKRSERRATLPLNN